MRCSCYSLWQRWLRLFAGISHCEDIFDAYGIACKHRGPRDAGLQDPYALHYDLEGPMQMSSQQYYDFYRRKLCLWQGFLFMPTVSLPFCALTLPAAPAR